MYLLYFPLSAVKLRSKMNNNAYCYRRRSPKLLVDWWAADIRSHSLLHCRIKTTWALAHRKNYGPMVLLETLALYSYMIFENAKVAKNWKRTIFFKLKPTILCCHQTIVNMKFWIYISEKVNYVVKTS